MIILLSLSQVKLYFVAVMFVAVYAVCSLILDYAVHNLWIITHQKLLKYKLIKIIEWNYIKSDFRYASESDECGF